MAPKKKAAEIAPPVPVMPEEDVVMEDQSAAEADDEVEAREGTEIRDVFDPAMMAFAEQRVRVVGHLGERL